MNAHTPSRRPGVPTEDIRVLDLFAGVGGLSQGLREASERFRAVGAVEFEPRAAAGWKLNHKADIYPGRIQDWVRNETIPDADVVIGGPPCQGFSTLGKQDANDERSTLWQYYVEVVARSKPRFFVMENVPAMLTSEQFQIFQKSTAPGGELADYDFKFDVLNAAEYGAAQTRRRAILIGHHKDVPAPGLPQPQFTDPERQATVRQTIGELYDPLTPDEWRAQMADRDPDEGYLSRELHVSRNYRDLSLRRFAAIREGGNRFQLPEDLQCAAWRKHKTGSADVMGRLHWDKPSVTLRTEFNKPEKGRYLHPEHDRAITAHEGARLQGFPDDYRFVGPMTEVIRQIGNAVPIPLGKAIGSHLLSFFDAGPCDSHKSANLLV